MAHYVILRKLWSTRFEWLITMYMYSESLSKLACVPFGDSHARRSPLSTHVSPRRLVYLLKPSPSLLLYLSPSPPPSLCSSCSSVQFKLCPCQAKSRIKIFLRLHEKLYRAVIWHIYSKGFVHVTTYRTRHTFGITFLLLWILSDLPNGFREMNVILH